MVAAVRLLPDPLFTDNNERLTLANRPIDISNTGDDALTGLEANAQTLDRQ